VKDGRHCQNRGYDDGDAHCWHTPCQHLERIRSHEGQQDYPRKFTDYSRYPETTLQLTTNGNVLIRLECF